MTNKLAFSCMWENVKLTNINTYHRWQNWVCEEGQLVPRCKAPNLSCCRNPCLPNVDVANTVCGSPVLLIGQCCEPCPVGLVNLGRKAYLKQRPGVPNKTPFHQWSSWYLPIFLLRDGSLTLMNMAFLMVIAMVCDFLPTIEKLSNLVWWPGVLAWP